MKFEYFGDIDNEAKLSAALYKYSETELTTYEPFSRTAMCDELRVLCNKFKVTVPHYIMDMLADPNKYTEIALRNGQEPVKPFLDEFNEENGTNIDNYTDLAENLSMSSEEDNEDAEDDEDDDDEDDEALDSEEDFVNAAFKNTKH